jgi:GT2 family glycosyltransferase
MSANPQQPPVSIVIVSFNTRDLLRECLLSLYRETEGIAKQVICADNASRDGSADMVAAEFPEVELVRSETNLGFAGGNNLAFSHATGRYVVLLNSDAFLQSGSLQRAIAHMEAEASIGIGGARLIGRDGSWQPSARLFPSLLNDFLTLSGLSAKFPKSRAFGRPDRTWADDNQASDVDWVPGAFSIVRRDALERVGYFDENFFLYYEEVDLCKRFKNAGYRIHYWPDVVVVHLGGESSKTLKSMTFSESGSQLTLWRMRSAFLYYRKHHGGVVWCVKELERLWHWFRAFKNRSRNVSKTRESERLQELLQRAWKETAGGKLSPGRPW